LRRKIIVSSVIVLNFIFLTRKGTSLGLGWKRVVWYTDRSDTSRRFCCRRTRPIFRCLPDSPKPDSPKL